jgi:hypothetical protein
MSLKDLLVVDGLVWSGEIAGGDSSGVFTGYDPLTGEVKREFPPDIEVNWFHHRCYPVKATSQYILTGRNGTEFVDLDQETWKPHHWVRGGCIYGVMPCNGLMYAGWTRAVANWKPSWTVSRRWRRGRFPRRVPSSCRPSRVCRRARLRPPAGPPAKTRGLADLPARRGAQRSGFDRRADRIGHGLGNETRRPAQPPTIAAGQVFVSAVDAHTVHASGRRQTGGIRWSLRRAAESTRRRPTTRVWSCSVRPTGTCTRWMPPTASWLGGSAARRSTAA